MTRTDEEEELAGRLDPGRVQEVGSGGRGRVVVEGEGCCGRAIGEAGDGVRRRLLDL